MKFTGLIIPFKVQFLEKISKGEKEMTIRTKRYGIPGTLFRIPGVDGMFRISDVVTVLFERAADHWAEDGLDSREDFITLWILLHPIAGWTPTKKVYIHIFKKVGE